MNFSFPKIPPLIQGLFSFFLGFLFVLEINQFAPNEGTEFTGAFIGIVLFLLINILISVFHPSFFTYSVPSFFIFIGLVIALLLFARTIAHKSIWQFPEYIFMLKSIALFYVVASILVRLIRLLWEFAEADEGV